MGSQGSEGKKELIRFAIFCILVCTMWCVLYAVRLAPELTDPDCYLRLNRVQNLYEGGKWRGRSVRILTDTNLGPEIFYRTRHATIGSPY
jgi:hypothetical protein